MTSVPKKKREGVFKRKNKEGGKRVRAKIAIFPEKYRFAAKEQQKQKKDGKRTLKKELKTKRQGEAKKQQAIKRGIERPLSL